MLYWHLDVVHDEATSFEVTESHAKEVYAKIVHATTQRVEHSVETSMHADFLGGGFGIGTSLKASHARAATSTSEDQRSVAERMASKLDATYHIQDGQTLAVVTLMECDKVNNRKNSGAVSVQGVPV